MSGKELGFSSNKIGQLYPILLDYYGNIIDGVHRYGVDKKWKKVRLKHILTEKDRLIARIVSNNVRRVVSHTEKRNLLERLGEIYFKEVEPGGIAYKIAHETGMSYTWVMKYLPERFKNSVQSNRRFGSVTRRVTTILDDVLKPPKREGALKIQRYSNTHFVAFTLERNFYEEFERDSLELGLSTELGMLKALENYHVKMKKAITIKKLNERERAVELEENSGKVMIKVKTPLKVE